MLEELIAMPVETAITTIIILIVMILFIVLALISMIFPIRGINRIIYDAEPNPNCPECHGTGILNPGHKHVQCDCPCKIRFLR